MIERIAERYEADPVLKFISQMRKTIGNSIRSCGFIKDSKTKDILGMEIEQFRNYLESQFEPWMNWDNKGTGDVRFPSRPREFWDIDHIIPLSYAKTQQEVIDLSFYINLRPFCSYDNRYVKRAHLPCQEKIDEILAEIKEKKNIPKIEN